MLEVAKMYSRGCGWLRRILSYYETMPRGVAMPPPFVLRAVGGQWVTSRRLLFLTAPIIKVILRVSCGSFGGFSSVRAWR